jgi:hypothetical protein
MVRKEPHALVAGSLLSVCVSLPVATAGPARLATARYMALRERGESATYRDALRFAFVESGGAGWLMGLTDALALLMAGGCVVAMLSDGAAMALRALYSGLFVIDMAYLASGIYRYPALADEPGSRVTMMVTRGFLMTLANPGWTLLFICAQLLALVICAATGVGLVALFPAASSLLEALAYEEMSSAYTEDGEPDFEDTQDSPDE